MKMDNFTQLAIFFNKISAWQKELMLNLKYLDRTGICTF